MSRLPAISGTVEHTTLALAIFARTGASISPAAGGSRNSPPMRSRLSLNAARREAGRSASNNGTAGSGRSSCGRFARIDAKISSRLLMFVRDFPGFFLGFSGSPAVCLIPAVEGLLGRVRQLAMLPPGVKAVVDDEARQMGERKIGRGDRSTISGRPREHFAGRLHRGFLDERNLVLLHQLAPPGIDLLMDVDLDRANIACSCRSAWKRTAGCCTCAR